MLPQQTRTSFVLDGLSRFGSRSDLVPDLWVLADAVLGYHHLLCKWQYGSPLLGFVRCHGVRFLVAALGPGGLGPGIRRIVRTHNRGSKAAVAEDCSGGDSVLACCIMSPFSSGDLLFHGGWGLQGRGLCVTLSFEVGFWCWGLVPGAF